MDDPRLDPNSQIVSAPNSRSRARFYGVIGSKVFRALTGAYGVSVTVLLLMRWLIGEQWALVTVFNSFLLLLVIRRRGIGLTVLAPAVFFVWTYGSLFIPAAWRTHPDTAPHLKFLTFNALRDNFDADGVLDIIRQSDADIVALQEVNPALAARLDADFATLNPYRALHPADNFNGQGVLSRYKMSEDEYWILGLGHERVKIAYPAAPLVLYDTHPVHIFTDQGIGNQDLRRMGIDEILRRAGWDTTPVLIAGDFNLADLGEDYGRITEHYQDSWREAGWGLGFTFPARLYQLFSVSLGVPVVRIDYVFHDAHFVAVEAHVVGSSGGSDHRPLFVTLALVNRQAQ